MRKKLLQHTLSAAIAAWALSMAQGPGSTAVDNTVASVAHTAQLWAVR